MTSSSDSQFFIGLLNDDDSSVPFYQHTRKAGTTATRRSSLDSLHELANFLPDFDDLAAFGGSDPLLDMPIMAGDNGNTDEYFVSTSVTSRRTSSAAIKSKRRASTDAFVAFHRTMESSSMASFETARETSSTSSATTTSSSIQAISSSFAASMLKSSQTREQLDCLQRQAVMHQQQGQQQGGAIIIPTTPTNTPQTKKMRQLTPETVTSAAQFLSGKRPTLTAALEESRKKLKTYQDKLGCTTY